MPKKFIERYKRSSSSEFLRSLLRVVNMLIAIAFFFIALLQWGEVGDVGVSGTIFRTLGLFVFWLPILLVTAVLWYLTRGEKEIIQVEE